MGCGRARAVVSHAVHLPPPSALPSASSVIVLNPLNQDRAYDAPVLRPDRQAGTVQRAKQQPVRAIEVHSEVAAQVSGQLMTPCGDQPHVGEGLRHAELLEPSAKALRAYQAERSPHLPLRPTNVREPLVTKEHVHAAYSSILY